MMKLVLNGTQTINILGQPKFDGDPVKLQLDVHSVEEIGLPAVGMIRVFDTIQWPNSNVPEDFELYSTNASDWANVYAYADTSFCGVDENGNVIEGTGDVLYYLVLTNVKDNPNIYVPTPEEREEERLAELARLKSEKIEKSKVDLAIFLEKNPLLWSDGEYYSVTATKQAQLTSNLALYNIAQAAGEPYELKWNSTGDVCKDWTIEDLSALALAIGNYVQPLVSYQQTKEVEVDEATTAEEVNAITIDYSTVWNETENVQE